jgi:hypothetical protein
MFLLFLYEITLLVAYNCKRALVVESGFSLSISLDRGSPYSYITCGVNNRPVGGCSSET